MKRAVVTGATGFVGSHLCRELLDHGYYVTALHRKSSDLGALNGLEIEYAEADIKDPDSLRDAFSGADVIFHIAALFREAKHPDSEYWHVNVDGTKNVLEVAIEKGVTKIIHCSTVGVHSHIPNPPANEDEPYRPGDVYQETKCEGEKLALTYFRDKRIDGCVVRPAMIWGPGDRRTLKLFKGIAERRLPIIGTGKTLLHWVNVNDLVIGFRLAYETSNNCGEIYIMAGQEAIQLRDLFRAIASELGVGLLPFRIPAFPVQLLGALVETICIPLRIEPPIYRRRVDFFTKTRAFDWSKAKRDLEYQPEGSIEDEIAAIIQSYRALKWLY